MKHISIGLLAALTLLSLSVPRAAATINDFNDLAIWSGSGPNQSALVIQWNDGKSPTALAWGFNWASPGSVNDMLLAVLASDVRLFVRGDSETNLGPSYFGFGYGNSGNFSISGAVDENGSPAAPLFVGGLWNTNTNPASTQAPTTSVAAVPSNPLDRYREGWFDNGYWELFVGTGSSYPVGWTSSLIGIGEPLANNSWYVLSFSNPDFSSNPPAAATAAVPEPATLILLLLAGGALLYARKRLHDC